MAFREARLEAEGRWGRSGPGDARGDILVIIIVIIITITITIITITIIIIMAMDGDGGGGPGPSARHVVCDGRREGTIGQSSPRTGVGVTA